MFPAMDEILEVSRKNLQRAREIIADTNIIAIWESIGATINQVGSVKSELLVKHRDIDFHIYTPELDITASFKAMAKLAEHPSIKTITYGNLIDTEECCIEWHAWYEDKDGDLWQIDMIHIKEGSFYDGYMEKVTDSIIKALTPETRRAILELKYHTPDDEKIPGILYYQAVMRDGIRDYAAFEEWRKANPLTGVVHWAP